MKNYFILLFALVCLPASVQYVYSQQNIPAESSSPDISLIVKKEIENLNYTNDCRKTEAAQKLGEMKSDALLAVPHLIVLLDHKSSGCEVHGFDFSLQIFMVNSEALFALESITGRNFHWNKEKWMEWWEQNKGEFLLES